MSIRITDWTPLPDNSSRADRRLFAIGDVHGDHKAFKRLTDHLRAYIGTGSGAILVYLGDYVDRGPQPLRVLESVAAGLGLSGLEEVALRGNHDKYLIDAALLEQHHLGLADLSDWMRWGGAATVDALKIPDDLIGEGLAQALRRALGADVCDFLRARPYRHQVGGFTCVHAGLNPDRPFDNQTLSDLITIRGAFLNPAGGWPFDTMVIHGHTVQKPAVHGHRIGVDIGVYRNGKLSAVEINGDQARFHIYEPN